jgi:hypothetical protein
MKYLRAFLCLAVVALVAACTTPGQGAGATGNPGQSSSQPATNLAQTVGNDQAAVPSTSNGGQGFINNHFASESDATVRIRLLEIAEANKWSPEQIESALKASSSAPQSVTITGNSTAQGGNSSAIGSGTGGGAGGAGSSVTKP